MRGANVGSRNLLLGSLALLGIPIGAAAADDQTYHRWHGAYYSHARLQCVPFARADSGVEIVGNASTWWYQAAGKYQRGQAPEPGAVLSFASTGRMRLGHVAVVSRIVNAREIEIDHANWWGPGAVGGVNRNVPVVDVSENNDWTAVRVAVADGRFGSVYPTHGFIYDRADNGTIEVASSGGKPAPVPPLDPAPTDRPARKPTALQLAESGVVMTGPISYDEVAEAPDDGVPAMRIHSWKVSHRHVPANGTSHVPVSARQWTSHG